MNRIEVRTGRWVCVEESGDSALDAALVALLRAVPTVAEAWYEIEGPITTAALRVAMEAWHEKAGTAKKRDSGDRQGL